MNIILEKVKKGQIPVISYKDNDINNRAYHDLFSGDYFKKDKVKAAVCQKILDHDFLQVFFENLASKPYCTDLLGTALLIRPKYQAVTKVYIQPNPIHCIYWLVFDLDYEVYKNWNDEFPVPNMSVENPHNGHQHIMYLLETPVYKLQNARLKPLNLLADVERGISLRFGADPSYGKLISKNPLHPVWKVMIWHMRSYTLGDLLVPIPREYQRRNIKQKDEIGVGRNCRLFEQIRHYSYSEAYRVKYNYEKLLTNVLEYAEGYNSGFDIPLMAKEVKNTVRSVCRWTCKKMDTVGFLNWCSIRGKRGNIKSQIVRSAKSYERADEVKALYASGKTQKQIGLLLGINQSQVSRLLSESYKSQ